MKPMDYLRCADCHPPSCEGCDNTLRLTREDLMRLKEREAIITMLWRLSNDAEALEDRLLNNDDDNLFQGMGDRLVKIKDELNDIFDRLSIRMEVEYGYEEDKQ